VYRLFQFNLYMASYSIMLYPLKYHFSFSNSHNYNGSMVLVLNRVRKMVQCVLVYIYFYYRLDYVVLKLNYLLHCKSQVFVSFKFELYHIPSFMIRYWFIIDCNFI